MKRLLIGVALASVSLMGPLSLSAQAQVYINGRLVEGQELQQLEYALGTQIYPGRYLVDDTYWVNLDTGSWGYAGSGAVQGNIYQGGVGGSYGGSTNSSCGGTWGSDGGCSYISIPGSGDVLVGDC